MFKYLFTLILLASGSLYAEIYKWTDDKGTVHFSDKAAPGSIKFDLKESKVVSSPKVLLEDISNDNYKTLKKEHGYKQISFIKPKDNETNRDTKGRLSVNIGLEPDLKKGDKIQLLVDGFIYKHVLNSKDFIVEGLTRGSHKLIAQVINEKGVVVISSKSINIYMMPPRLGMVHKINQTY